MPSISDVYGKVSASFLHWSFPRSVRRGSRMVWLAMLRLWKPWAWRMKVIVGGMVGNEEVSWTEEYFLERRKDVLRYCESI